MLEHWFQNRVVAWAGIAVGSPLLIFSGPALWSSLSDGDDGKGWHNAWPVWGCLTGLLLLGLGLQHFWENRKPRNAKGPGTTEAPGPFETTD
ncbi:hypothetical protein [Lentzea terrae]|uniref:hypothetical protein n=1 Tax=Lentzea terrae TaxID=2200761 RepID=UPI000DD3C8D1|nr:hypothetical protein [Lentzea terrae]